MAKVPTTNEKPSANGDTAAQLSADLKKVQDELDKATASLSEKDKQIAALKSANGDVAELGKELDSARSRISELTTDLSIAEGKLEKANERIAELEARPKAGDTPEPAKKTGGLRIAARPKDGFRRCGIHHPPSPVDHEPGAFTDEQVKTLKDDPNLSVVDI